MNNKPTYQYDSRQIQPGDTYICLPKGDAYIKDALKRGASKVKKMTRLEMAELAHTYFQNPSESLTVVGITGTNGKSTVASLVHQGLMGAGFQSAILGTLNSPLTTPESWDIHALMAEHVAKGGTHFVMEVSSHGIDQNRVYGIDFDVKLLTNITRDHLDYHNTFEDYRQTKLSFMKTYSGCSILDYERVEFEFENPLRGRFNDSNMKAAVAILRALTLPEQDIDQTLSQATAPPGRFEWIDEGQPFSVIVDYAHTPDSLKNVLEEIQHHVETSQTGRILTLFGCGGDRDRGKRPQMGQIVAALSDYFVITADNPRSESQARITSDILAGFTAKENHYVIEEDRGEAIRHILQQAQPGDVVLIAGKGHETTQMLASGPIHFDDRDRVRKGLKA